MTPDEWTAKLSGLTDELHKLLGSEGAVVIMIGLPDGSEHSTKRWQWRGRCLVVEGLLTRCTEEIRKDVWGQKS